ncbi:hypothetical protein CJ030_MR5G023953 [Morella rubra]|uniref:Uncharacterized protein n=1 Tax=Morella rubra TaxID=262757 RepID=A0A6A1VI13_9ROSI|nr:hypothetical protein CJ030_MR5G023953 [Morella rubra]
MFDYIGSSDFVGLKCDPYLIKQSFANFAFIVNVDATSLVKGKDLDFSVSSLNAVAHSSNSRIKFLESYTKIGMFDVEPIEILWAILDDPSMTEVAKPEANDFNIHWRLLHHIVYKIILPRTRKFEYVIFLDLFVMYCLITRRQMNHGPIESHEGSFGKRRQGLPYRMLLAQIFQLHDVDNDGDDHKKPKASKEYNQKTLRLMRFIQNEDGEWVKK